MKDLTDEDTEDDMTGSVAWKCITLAYEALKRIPETIVIGDNEDRHQSMVAQLCYVERCLETAEAATHFEFVFSEDDGED